MKTSLHDWLISIKSHIESSIGAMLEKSVSLSVEAPRRLVSSDYTSLLPDGPLGIKISFDEAGGWHFLLSRGLAATIADLASMGDGSATFNEDLHPEAIKEIFSQVSAELGPELATLLGEAAKVSPAEIAPDPDAVIAAWGGDPAVVWSIKIENWGEGRFIQLFEKAFLMNFEDQAEAQSETPAEAARPDAPESDSPARTRQPLTGRAQQGPVARPAAFEDFGPQARPTADPGSRNIDTVLDISLPITIELGRTKMLIREVLDLGPGSVIELDKMSGEPVDLFVNDKRFARGEVVVIEENFGVRITELIKVEERIKALK